MHLATSTESRMLDKCAMEDFGIPGIVLMENAARSIDKALFEFWPSWPSPPKAAFLIGPGQNGGDGWALARILNAKGFKVHCFALIPEGKKIAGDAAINYNIALNMGLPIKILHNIQDASGIIFDNFDLLVDALFGIGLDRSIEDTAAMLLYEASLAKSQLGKNLRILAVDIPSSLSADTGDLLGPPLKADLTVSLGIPKLGLYLKNGPSLSGRIVVGDIGLTPGMIAQKQPLGRLCSPDELRHYLPPRPQNAHKGSFGHCYIAGGAKGKTGALCLSCLGALRSGAGLVTAMHPASLASIYETKLTEAMTVELPEETPGELADNAVDNIIKFSKNSAVLAIGPGLGLGKGAEATVHQVIEKCRLPLVLDADALTHIGSKLSILSDYPESLILTPHPGEAAKLLGCDSKDIQDNRLAAARQIASESGAIVLLKGQGTIISEPSGKFFLNPGGGSHMSIGGSGDILTGLIASLLAQEMEAFYAAALGAWLHSRAADICREKIGPVGLLASDFADYIPQAFEAVMCDVE